MEILQIFSFAIKYKWRRKTGFITPGIIGEYRHLELPESIHAKLTS